MTDIRNLPAEIFPEFSATSPQITQGILGEEMDEFRYAQSADIYALGVILLQLANLLPSKEGVKI